MVTAPPHSCLLTPLCTSPLPWFYVGDGCASSGRRPKLKMTAQQPTNFTSPTAAPLPSTLARVLELYRQCLDNGEWAKCVLECRNGVETISFRCDARAGVRDAGAPTTTEAVSNCTRRHVRPSRRRRNRRRRREMLEKRAQPTPPRPEPPPPSARPADLPPLHAVSYI